MIAHKKQFMLGTALLAAFCVVLVFIFLPLFNGQNALNYMDSLFNSISKGSAYYIEDLREEAKVFEGRRVDLTLKLEDAAQAEAIAPLFARSGATVDPIGGAELKVTGDLGGILAGCLEDTDNMFENNGAALAEKYGMEERKVMYGWWKALKAADKAFKRQKMFAESKFVLTVIKKGVECSYNYYGIEPQKISEQVLVVLIALVFYVVYTIWYGFAIMFMFEGWGLKLEH
jgi:hypothetical protein